MPRITPNGTGTKRIAWNRLEFGDRWGLGRATVDRLIKEGRLGCYKVGQRSVITSDHEAAWLASMEAKAS